ncbi:MAG: SMC-Scp complex subunit ScpB [Calditrichaceae bacterium]|nr:SMC-Scp complex subunit ScpB [Calditrichaceae bacterium]
MKDQDQIIEALIFASDVPLPSRKIKDIISEVGERDIKKSIARINQRYQETNSAFEIVEVAGGYQMVTRADYADWIRKLYISRTKNRLTQKALETLAIIAYKQPITKTEVESIRGVNADTVIRTLIERKLITVTGREKAPGNPLLYGTTRYFLEYFGLKDLSDLPKLREIDELLKSDEKFLESLDQVSLQQLIPEELGISSMLSTKTGSAAIDETDIPETGDENETDDSQEDIQEDKANDTTE